MPPDLADGRVRTIVDRLGGSLSSDAVAPLACEPAQPGTVP
jgi:hypothetical protein